MDRYRIIEKTIIKTYRKTIFSKFVKAIKDYELIKDNDKIAVCLSGGKDSFLLAKCMEEFQKHGMFKFELEFLIMNPGYNKKTLENIERNLKILNIKTHIFETPIFKIIKNAENPCYLCAKMRRGYLYDYASKLGCNKIALGHHYDDVLETILLNLIYSGSYSSMMPKLKSDNFEGIELIRPLYLIREKDIINWKQLNGLEFIDCACAVTKKQSGKRKEMKKLIEELKKYNKDADKSIFTSAANVNLNTIISYKKDRKNHSFLENYKNWCVKFILRSYIFNENVI